MRGPLDSGQADAPLTCERGTCTGAEVVLPRGRYYASLFAVAARPLGSVTPGEEHFADGMGSNGVADCPHLPRGQGNGRAFTASLKRGGVPPHRDEPSPMGGGAGGGIEIGYDVATCAGHVTDGSDSYSPNVSVDGCGTGPGRPALRSDHLPVGARLRIYGR